MRCRQEDAIAFAQQQTRPKSGRRGVGMKKTAGDVSRLQGGELRRSGRFGELESNPRMTLVKVTQDPGQDRGHRESGESDADVTGLTARQRLYGGGDCRQAAQQGL